MKDNEKWKEDRDQLDEEKERTIRWKEREYNIKKLTLKKERSRREKMKK